MPSDNKELRNEIRHALGYCVAGNPENCSHEKPVNDYYDPEEPEIENIVALIADQCQEAYKRGYIDAGVEALREEA